MSTMDAGHGAVPADEPEAHTRARTLGELFSRLTENLSILMRQEVALAKAEATESAKRAGSGIGLFAGGALAALLFLIFLSTALMWALASGMHAGWAALIVALLWAIAAAVLVWLGKKQMDEIKGVPKTQESLKDIPPTMNPKEQTP